ncbi:hypothetical protein LTR17_014240 [Elasticomyces elasticus]|nr:hypothetical protein LTR17_014240 [Elasticomyces elasticus]
MLETKKKKKEEYEAKKAAAAAAAAATVPSPSVVGGAAAPVPNTSLAGDAAAPVPPPFANVDEPPAKRSRLAIADLLASPTTASQQQTWLPSPASARRPGEVDSGEKDIGNLKVD